MVGILTFHWADDYGAMLQAYALKRQLERLGEEAELIPYAPLKLTGRYWFCPLCAVIRAGKRRYYIHRHLMKQNLKLGRSFWARRRNMRSFRRRYLTAQPPIRSVDKLSLQKYKTVFVGSDQVWNPEITVGLDDAYIGNIPQRGNCRLAAYGASLGGTSLSESDRQKAAMYVGGGFSAVSLREQTDAASMESLLDRSVQSVLDPVLLLDWAEWEKIGAFPHERDCILVYLVEPNLPLLHFAQVLSAQTGKKIVSIAMRGGGCSAAPGVETLLECGPAEFIGCLRNAFCVLTNSFHGTAFSILLEKFFLSFRHSTRSIRQENMLCKLGLPSYLVQSVHLDEAWSLWANTDWEEVRRRLAEERERSTRFILDNIT